MLHDAAHIHPSEFDLLILSGSSHLSAVYDTGKLAGELDLIRTSTKPILGVCFGAELINLALGGTLKDLGPKNKERGAIEVEVIHKDAIFNGRARFLVYDAHRWVIDGVAPELEVLARSKHGPEVIRHRARPIYGFQFHPEKMTDETYGDELYANFIERFGTVT